MTSFSDDEFTDAEKGFEAEDFDFPIRTDVNAALFNGRKRPQPSYNVNEVLGLGAPAYRRKRKKGWRYASSDLLAIAVKVVAYRNDGFDFTAPLGGWRLGRRLP